MYMGFFVRSSIPFFLVALLHVPNVLAETESVTLQRAEGRTLSRAVGHFARARTYLIAAIREFDAGSKIADPGALIDTVEWREILLGRAEDLERVLDPQPRASQAGITFNPDPRLLGGAKD